MAQDPDLENLRKNAAYQKIKAIVRQIRVKRAKII
jgi:hypothetical protein